MNTLIGTKADDGTTITAVKVVPGSEVQDGASYTMKADISFNDGSKYRETVTVAANGNTSVTADYQEVAPRPTARPSTQAPPPPTQAPSTPVMTDSQAQAVQSALNYLSDGQGFSYNGLLQQLTSSYGAGFSQSDAEFALNYLHPDWDAQAVEAAKNYLSDGQGFSRDGLIQQLDSPYGGQFTYDQARVRRGPRGPVAN